MPANREGSSQPFLKKNEHICREDCFPVTQVTFFCFSCDEEIFKPQIGKHGRRSGGSVWYLCRDCLKARLEEHAKKREELGIVPSDSWIETGTGPIKMGPQGVPSAKTLNDRKKQGRFLK